MSGPDPRTEDPNARPSGAPPAAPGGRLTSDQLIDIINGAVARAQDLAELPHYALVDKFDPFTGKKIGQAYEKNGIGDQFNDVMQLGTVALQQLNQQEPTASARLAAGTAAAQLLESARQFDANYKRQTGRDAVTDEQWGKTFQQNAAVLAETTRGHNITGALDLAQQQIAIGDLNAKEATNRITAATSAANVERGVLADWGGRNLPRDTPYFPNAGPTGPLATAAQALGVAFPGFATGGTFGINPGAFGPGITGAAGPSGVPGAQDALSAAARALAGMGVPGAAAVGAGR